MTILEHLHYPHRRTAPLTITSVYTAELAALSLVHHKTEVQREKSPIDGLEWYVQIGKTKVYFADPSVIKTIRPSTHKLLDLGLHKLTQELGEPITEMDNPDEIDYTTVTVYTDELCYLNYGEVSRNKKNNLVQHHIYPNLTQFLNVYFRSRTDKTKMIKILNSVTYKAGEIKFQFTPEFVEHVKKKSCIQYPAALFLLNTNWDINAWYMAKTMFWHWNILHNAETKTFNRMKVKSLLKYMPCIQEYEVVMKSQCRSWRCRIAAPFYDAWRKLKEAEVLDLEPPTIEEFITERDITADISPQVLKKNKTSGTVTEWKIYLEFCICFTIADAFDPKQRFNDYKKKQMEKYRKAAKRSQARQDKKLEEEKKKHAKLAAGYAALKYNNLY